MPVKRPIGVFPITVVTDPPQYGLAANFVVRRYEVSTGEELPASTNITEQVTIREYMEPVTPYTGEITVSSDRLRGLDRIAVTGDTAQEIGPGDIISLGGDVYKVRKIVTDEAGDRYYDLDTPLRKDVAAGAVIQQVGNTGRYCISINESAEATVQYSIEAAIAIPVIRESTPILEIVSASELGGGVTSDNSKLLL